MSVLEVAAIIAAGFAAGTINTIVGSGSLITFPTLLVLGYPPLTANVSNNIGLVPGAVSGSYGYRHELAGRSRTLARLGSAVVPRLSGGRRVAPRPAARGVPGDRARPHRHRAGARPGRTLAPAPRRRAVDDGAAQPGWHRWALGIGIFVAGIYGGYFGAAQGVLLMGIFSALSSEPLQRLNAYKNVLSSSSTRSRRSPSSSSPVTRSTGGWSCSSRSGSFIGGVVGARIGRRIPPAALRGLIVVIGMLAIVKLVSFP